MKTIKSLTAALTLLASSATAKDVYWDEGGLLNARGQEVHNMLATGEGVNILGVCLSACTMYLKLPNACVSKNALLMFHGPYSLTGDETDAETYSNAVQWMANYYPAPIADWFTSVGHDGDHWMRGQLLIDNGVAECL